jgi:hypothetical protein
LSHTYFWALHCAFFIAQVQGNHEYNLLRWRRRGAPLPDPQKKIKESYAATVKDLEDKMDLDGKMEGRPNKVVNKIRNIQGHRLQW